MVDYVLSIRSPAVAGASTVADPTQLPVAQNQTSPSIAAVTVYNADGSVYNASMTPGNAPKNKYFFCPTTGVKIWKLTDNTLQTWVPGNNLSAYHGYGSPSQIGYPDSNGDYTLVFGGNQINNLFQKFRPGYGLVGSGVEPATLNGGPGQIREAMSRNPDTPHKCYMINGNGLEAFNTETGASLGVVDATVSSGGGWMLNSYNDEVICWQEPLVSPTALKAKNISGGNLGGSWADGVIRSWAETPNELAMTMNGRYLFAMYAGYIAVPVFDLYTNTDTGDTLANLDFPHQGHGWDYIMGIATQTTGDVQLAIAPTRAVPDISALNYANWGGHSTAGWLNPEDTARDHWFLHANGQEYRTDITQAKGHLTFIKADGSDTRLLTFTYSGSVAGSGGPDTPVDDYYGTAFPTLSPDGKLCMINSQGGVDSGRVDVYVIEVPTKGNFPNEPAGFTTIHNTPFDNSPPDGWTFNAASQGGSVAIANGEVTWTYSTDLNGGYEPGGMYYDEGETWGPRLYLRLEGLEPSSNFESHSSGVNKIGFLLKISDVVNGYLFMDGTDLDLQVNMQGFPEFGTTPELQWNEAGNNASPTLAQAQVQKGQENTIEILVDMGTPGNADGTWKTWLNDVLIHDYTGLSLTASTGNPNSKIRGFQHKPIWGGTGGNPSQEFTLKLRHTYISQGT